MRYRRSKGTSRSIQLVTGSSHQQHNSEPLPTPDSSTYSLTLPIVGIIAAGPGIQPIENLEELDLADLIPRHADVFALKVQGTSMIEDAIADGDVVLVERRNEARNGETVVAAMPPDGEVTLKRYYAEDGHIRLQPANSSMDPIIIKGDVEIQGVVISVIRRM